MDLCDLTVEISRGHALTKQFHTMHVRLNAASAVLNANLIHKWMKDPRFAPLGDSSDEFIDAAFLPVEVDAAR